MKNGGYWAPVRRDQIAGLPTGSATDIKVWLVIKSFAFDRDVASVGYSEIARLVGIDRKNVPRSIRRLEAGGSLRRVRGGPRGHTKNIYLLPAAGDDQADAETSVVTAEDRSVVTAEDRSVVTAEDRSVLTADDRSVLTVEDPLEKEEKVETPPLRGGRARAQGARPSLAGGGGGSQPIAGKQAELLLPIAGTGGRNGNGVGRPAYDITRYEPSPELILWARREYDVDATADSLLGSFRDHQPRIGRWPPPDPERAFKNWIRREAKFVAAARQRPARRAHRSSILESGSGRMGRWAS